MKPIRAVRPLLSSLLLCALAVPAVAHVDRASEPRAANGGELALERRRVGERVEFEVSGLAPGARGALVIGTELRTTGAARSTVVPSRTHLFRADHAGRAAIVVELPESDATIHAQALTGGGIVGVVHVSSIATLAGPMSLVQRGDVVITEIARAPGLVSDALGEWFEARNVSNSAIDLEGWKIRSGPGEQHVIQNGGQGLVVLSGGRIVFGTNGVLATNGGVDVDYDYAGLTFDDQADSITLVEPGGLVVDDVAWTNGGGWPASVTGRALALDPASTDAASNDLAASWCLASTPIDILVPGTDRGTPGDANPSCACQGAGDSPDALFLDSNCDGIDGEVARAVFVAVGGAPNATGSAADPLGSVQAAIDLAQVAPSRDHVYVSEGTYAEAITLKNGVSIWGGYSAANGWSRSASYVTTWTNASTQSDGVVGVRGISLTSAIVVGDVRVVTGAATGAGAHNIGIRLHAVSNLRLERVEVVAGPGAAGVAGANGTSTSSGFHSGGSGGDGGNALGGGWDGDWGNGSGGGSGGNGGSINNNGSNGGAGSAGWTGNLGTPASNVGSLVPGTGLWSVASLGNTGGFGEPGSGGGGGGGGGGGLFPGFPGGGGGSGGSGGRGGAGGQGGTGGGSSLGLLASGSNVVVVDCELRSGNGAAGGTGGAGRVGLAGNSGSLGSAPSGAGDGGRGGNGGTGGTGGRGAGGGGGHSHAVVIGVGSVVDLQSVTLSVGTAGAGGVNPDWNDGLAGTAQLIKQL